MALLEESLQNPASPSRNFYIVLLRGTEEKFSKNRRLANDVYIKITTGRVWISQNRAILALDAEQ